MSPADRIPSQESVLYREMLLADAYYEMEDASAHGDKARIVKSGIDMIRVIVGTLFEYGAHADKVWDAVRTTNCNVMEAIYGESQEAR